MSKRVSYVFKGGSDHHIPSTPSKRSSGWGFITAVFVALTLVFFAQGSALATQDFLDLFNGKYGTDMTALDTCSLCHTSIPALNPYGQDFMDAGADVAAFDTIANNDSDGDGATNITEINALTFPGNPASMPPVTPAGLPVPDSQSVFTYEAVVSPQMSETPQSARPVGLGQVATGGSTVDVSLGLAPTAGPVDVYVAIQINFGELLILNSNGLFQTLNDGVVPFKSNSMGDFNQSLYGAIPVSLLPPATYSLYLMVTPAGSFATYYLYVTGFTVAGP